MKLGCSWNVFDGEELLEGSIKQIRQHVDYVSVSQQNVSSVMASAHICLVYWLAEPHDIRHTHY